MSSWVLTLSDCTPTGNYLMTFISVLAGCLSPLSFLFIFDLLNWLMLMLVLVLNLMKYAPTFLHPIVERIYFSDIFYLPQVFNMFPLFRTITVRNYWQKQIVLYYCHAHHTWEINEVMAYLKPWGARNECLSRPKRVHYNQNVRDVHLGQTNTEKEPAFFLFIIIFVAVIFILFIVNGNAICSIHLFLCFCVLF